MLNEYYYFIEDCLDNYIVPTNVKVTIEAENLSQNPFPQFDYDFEFVENFRNFCTIVRVEYDGDHINKVFVNGEEVPQLASADWQTVENYIDDNICFTDEYGPFSTPNVEENLYENADECAFNAIYEWLEKEHDKYGIWS